MKPLFSDPLETSKREFAVIAHDAGAANHIIAWLKSGHLELGSARICFEGPALELATRLNLEFQNRNVDEVLKGVNLLISGSGWGSPIEHEARAKAKRIGVFCVAVVDHWVNYRPRFSRKGLEVLPDEIWVTDNFAKELAAAEFPHTLISVKENQYIQNQIEESRSYNFGRGERHRILFVMEPIRQKWNDSELPGEFQAFHFLINNLSRLGLDEDNVEIVIKPHPSDASGKYSVLKQDFKNVTLSIDDQSNLASCLGWADTVVGCHSYALVVALECGKRSVSCLPNDAPRCVLPQSEILRLSEMV